MQLLPNKHPFIRLNSSGLAKRTLVALVGICLWFGLLSWAVVNRQAIVDWWRLRGYQPSSAIVSLAQQTTMTDYGRKIFYVNQPEVASKTDFAVACDKTEHEEQTIVLGCYHGNQGGIYVLKVTDERLEGVQQVTAAHEMLHAAYDRLSKSERERIDALINNFYKNKVTDARILKTIDAYKNSEPKDLLNEMHSIFGTEVADLPDELEDYYQQYFTDRQQVVKFAQRYQEVFTSRQSKLRLYESQLDEIKTRVEVIETDIASRQAEINSRQAELNSLRQSNDIAAFNARVPEYNQLVEVYNGLVEEARGLIAQYNQLVAEYNALAHEHGELIKELDADIEPIKQ